LKIILGITLVFIFSCSGSSVEQKLDCIEIINLATQEVIPKLWKVVMPKMEIPQVGWLAKFLDTEGNIVRAIQYHKTTKL